MRYLTQVVVDNKTAARFYSDAYIWHQRIWKAFPGKEDSNRDFLTRIDRKPGCTVVLILSPDTPTPLKWGQWKTKQVGDAFLEHGRYMFQLKANPTVKQVVRDEAGNRRKNGLRRSITDPYELRQWMKRKAEQGGFALEYLEVSHPVMQAFRKRGKPGSHSQVDFRGILRVVNHGLFKKTFEKGIGTAKAFGFGMLVLQPAKGGV